MSYQMKKYMLAACALMSFGTGLVLLRHSLWRIGLLAGWETAGLIWYVKASRYEVWRKAGRRFGRPPLSIPRYALLVMTTLVYCLAWPLWLALGEDVFD